MGNSTPLIERAAVGDLGPVVAPWHNLIPWEPIDDDPYVTTELFHGEQRMGDAPTAGTY